jgi:endonuclease/exonuclease/phosphatase (EEP) superfamily protein YafD
MEANLWYGQADTTVLAGQVQEEGAQILALTEVSGSAAAELAEKLADILPYHLGEAGPEGSIVGTMVFSKYPLTEVPVEFLSLGAVAAEVSAEDGRFTIIAAHPANPLGNLEGWLNEGQSLTTMVNRRIAGPLIVAGDLNATNENLLMRRVLGAGMRDAAVDAGAGWVPTYPTVDLPALIGIDHVLVNKSFRTVGFHTIEIVGSDHRGVVAKLARA